MSELFIENTFKSFKSLNLCCEVLGTVDGLVPGSWYPGIMRVSLALVLALVASCGGGRGRTAPNLPVVITTWNFRKAVDRAWDVLSNGQSALDAVEIGGSACEALQCDGTVGYGGSPDESGEVTLDAMIMDGRDMNVGAVAALRNVKRAISVARRVLEHTSHSMLAGELATQFALSLGFKQESLSTTSSKKLWTDWQENNCQPNFWQAVKPDPKTTCGPYRIDTYRNIYKSNRFIDANNHDTIGMIAIDQNGDVAAGTSTNGAKYKIPGRVGDSPIPGSGAYADNTVGGAVGTGDGDVLLRFCPSFLVVEEMRRGATPTDAAQAAIKRISSHYPYFSGAVIGITKDGVYGAACHGMEKFPFVVHDLTSNVSVTKYVQCN